MRCAVELCRTLLLCNHDLILQATQQITLDLNVFYVFNFLHSNANETADSTNQ